MHEPLVIGLVLPSFKHKPWFCANTPLAEYWRRKLKSLFNEKEDVHLLLKEILKISADLKKMSGKDTENILSHPPSV